MAEELVFHINPMSRGRTVRWMLGEIGCPYQAEVLGYVPAMKSPEYLALNPMGKVPVVRRGEGPVGVGGPEPAEVAGRTRGNTRGGAGDSF